MSASSLDSPEPDDCGQRVQASGALVVARASIIPGRDGCCPCVGAVAFEDGENVLQGPTLGPCFASTRAFDSSVV